MKTKLLLFTLFLTLSQFASAQQTDSSNYSNALGVIASPVLGNFFYSNMELPVGIIYKRQHRLNTAFRFTILGKYNDYERTTKYFSPNNWNKQETYVQVTAGYEWQVDLGRRWALYYGAEAGSFFSNASFDDLMHERHPQNFKVWTGHGFENKRGILIRPFAGVSFKITDRFHISTETGIIARHQRREVDSTEEIIFAPSGEFFQGVYEHHVVKENSINYQPLSNISLILRF